VQPKNSAAAILTNDLNHTKEPVPPVNSLEAAFSAETNLKGPLTLDARGLSLDQIADRLAKSNT
jgi:hypothetical protein